MYTDESSTNKQTKNVFIMLETLESLKINFTHSLGCNNVNVGNIGNELSTYSCMRSIYIYNYNKYLYHNQNTKHDIGLKILD